MMHLRTLWLMVLLLVASPSFAADKAAAESLFRAGKELMDEGRVAEACEKFDASMAAEESVGALLNLALCHEKLGKTATAWAEFQEAAGMAERAKQPDRAEGARAFAEKLEGKLSYLQVDVGQPVPGLVIERNGEALPDTMWGTAIATDPGTYELRAQAPGHEPWTSTIDIGEVGDRKTVAVPALVPGATPDTPDSASFTPTAGDDGGTSSLVIAGYTTAGIGVAVLAVGVALGVIATGDRDALEQDASLCPNRACTPEGLDQLDGIRAMAHGSTAAIVIGSVAVAAGFSMVIFAPNEGGEEVAVQAGLGSLGLRGRF